MSSKIKIIHIKDVDLNLIEEASKLFNEYRIFYKQNSDLDLQKKFLTERIKNKESEIFIATNNEKSVGFMQLYKSFSSVSLRKILILNDLYIEESFRKMGVGKILIEQAKNFAKESNITKITLSTGIENYAAQKLYENNGYKRNLGYFVYDLEIALDEK